MLEHGPEHPETREALIRLGDPRIRFRAVGERIGPARAMTRLIQEGTAPYVALLHDDDLWLPDFLERHVAFLEAAPTCGLVFSGNLVIDEVGRVIGRSEFVLPEGVHPPETFVPLERRRNLIATPTVLVRRAAYVAAGAFFDERFPTVFDYEMWLRPACRVPVGYRASHDACYRLHSSQITTSAGWRHRSRELLLLDEHVEALVKASEAKIPPDTAARRRRRANLLLSHALDLLEDDGRVAATKAAMSATATRGRVVLTPRWLGTVASIALGAHATRGLRDAHERRRRRRKRGASPP